MNNPGPDMSAVILDGVSKSFDGVRAVQGLSAQGPRRAIYGFLGPNGAGKRGGLPSDWREFFSRCGGPGRILTFQGSM
jgi:hypothetical protein